jgi:Protein of unknown function (DUF3159)
VGLVGSQPARQRPVPENRNVPRALLAQMGGVSGLISSSLPVVVFVPVSTAFGLMPAIGSALGVAALVLVWRLLRRESMQPAVSGFIGVAVCVAIAYLIGQSKGYFLLGIWSSLVYAGLFAGSVLVRRPLVGYIWGWVHDHDTDWRRVRKAVFAYDIATLIWALVFVSRFIVQRYLYDLDQTGWLGVARIAMGWPLTAAAALATYFPIKAAERAMPHRSPDVADEPVESTDEPVGGEGVDVDPKPSGP